MKMININLKEAAIKEYWQGWPKALKDFLDQSVKRINYFKEFNRLYPALINDYKEFECLTLNIITCEK